MTPKKRAGKAEQPGPGKPKLDKQTLKDLQATREDPQGGIRPISFPTCMPPPPPTLGCKW